MCLRDRKTSSKFVIHPRLNLIGGNIYDHSKSLRVFTLNHPSIQRDYSSGVGCIAYNVWFVFGSCLVGGCVEV
jgi:hypothetical protein